MRRVYCSRTFPLRPECDDRLSEAQSQQYLQIRREPPTFGRINCAELAAPEVIEPRPINTRVDMWTVGAIAYTL